MAETLHRATLEGAYDLLELHRRAPREFPFLLQSLGGHAQTAAHDILFAFPQGVITGGHDFFGRLDRAVQDAGAVESQTLPFCGGWFVYLGYEAVGHIEPAVPCPPSPYRLPDALAVRCPAAVIRDRAQGQVHLVAESAADLGRLQDFFQRTSESPPTGAARVTNLREAPPAQFIDGVERVRDYLAAGDVFQVNLSRGWTADFEGEVTALYQRLCRTNPAPFAGLMRWDDTAVLSSSPERLVQVRAGQVRTRPIAGTRPRAAAPEDDLRLREQLLASFKERAEHIMLIDLERNDLGRVCLPGSVEVAELMQVESHAHVHHIVSEVRGRLRPQAGPGDVLRAVFPGGTITGCPKVRAMQIIAEIEGCGRGPYTGAMGYLSRDGGMDLNILIRSLVCEGGALHFRTGAGIVADSDAQAELAETRAKARGLLLALQS